ncbi:MAG TPA: GNAT family N-acetyltransferase [Gemmatimonadaceae bacterium]|nr:GNAT family N-acetyltransferase [Gemmatimonadaceae bacterium]
MTAPGAGELRIRAAHAADAPAVAPLITELGYPTEPSAIPSRLAALDPERDAILVATRGDAVLGVMGLHRFHVVHRARPVAYITLMVIAAGARGTGIGRRLVEAAEGWARERGCERLTVTSGAERAGAHAFYERCGIPYTGRRFSKTLA